MDTAIPFWLLGVIGYRLHVVKASISAASCRRLQASKLRKQAYNNEWTEKVRHHARLDARNFLRQ
jgi:hypothetical protein